MEAAELAIQRRALKAPFDGTVVKVFRHVGEWVAPGDPVLQIVDLEGDPHVLKKLADATGGVAYFPTSDKKVIESFDEIATNIRRGYTIGYVPVTTREGRLFRVKRD